MGDQSQPDCVSLRENTHGAFHQKPSPEEMNEKLLPLGQMDSRLLAPFVGTTLLYRVQLHLN